MHSMGWGLYWLGTCVPTHSLKFMRKEYAMNDNDYAVIDIDTPDSVMEAADAAALAEYRDAFDSYVEGE